MFPTRFPLYTYLAVALSMVVACGSFFVWKRFASPLQVFYLSSASHYLYLTTGLPHFGLKPDHFAVFTDGDNLAAKNSPLDRVRCVAIVTTAKTLHDALARQVYDGGLDVALRWPLRTTGVFCVFALCAGVTLDGARRRSLREGVLLRGPKLISPRAYNRRSKGDGIRIELA